MSAVRPQLTSYGRGAGEQPCLVWRFDSPRRFIASAAVGGGLGTTGWVINAQVDKDFRRTDLDAHLGAIAADCDCAGAGGAAVAMACHFDPFHHAAVGAGCVAHGEAALLVAGTVLPGTVVIAAAGAATERGRQHAADQDVTQNHRALSTAISTVDEQATCQCRTVRECRHKSLKAKLKRAAPPPPPRAIRNGRARRYCILPVRLALAVPRAAAWRPPRTTPPPEGGGVSASGSPAQGAVRSSPRRSSSGWMSGARPRKTWNSFIASSLPPRDSSVLRK